MPSSPIHRFPLSDNSTNNFECETTITEHYSRDKSYDDIKGQSQELLRKQAQRPFILQTQKSHCRRRYTFSGGHPDHKMLYKKRRRFASVALPTKFLLGGNIKDPLNLRSFEDEEINRQFNAFSPASSPLPIPHWRRSQVQIVIPQDIRDPLNLNTSDDIQFNLLSSKPRRRRRHRKGRKEDENIEDGTQISPTEELPTYTESFSQVFLVSLDDSFVKENKGVKTDIPENKIVSPVVPQGTPAKVVKKSLSRSISKDGDLKSPCKQKCLQPKVDKRDFRLKAYDEKFCYGNHTKNNDSKSCEEYDQRVQFLERHLFYGKDVLDIGCNTGNLTLYIAKNYEPKKILGVDIDRKLINVAQKKSCLFLSQDLDQKDFPQSLSAVYGPLVRVMQTLKPKAEFPNNVTFIEANYVPGSEELLETQQPEYDTILCLRVTKWIHLNFGDDGLKLAFKRMYSQLRFGGSLILEPQPWSTYSAHKRISPVMREMYGHLQMRPNYFCQYLLSEVGFTSCQIIGRTFNYKKGYRRDIFLLTKGCREDPSSMPTSTPILSNDSWTESSADFSLCTKDVNSN